MIINLLLFRKCKMPGGNCRSYKEVESNSNDSCFKFNPKIFSNLKTLILKQIKHSRCLFYFLLLTDKLVFNYSNTSIPIR